MSLRLEMKYYTCEDCGVTYGYPKHYGGSFCPLCLQREYNELKKETREESNKQYRTNCALRGVITKLKNRKG